MRLLIQRVTQASVTVDNKIKSTIKQGLLIFVGIINEDTKDDIEYLVKKALNLRIFDDEYGVMNKSVIEIAGEVLVVSQFTLHASTKKGNRPSYIRAAKPEISIPLYEEFCNSLSEQLNKDIQTGEFGADMKVNLINDGPVTILIDSKNREL
ncbi:MAG: D-tyrosyl-tRNA(Tyr) deacylase [Bacteroidales bacterium]|nr:D-tyrosyl-tRNA(Tyr) deacylase [Bacteroidales bacterium]